MELKNIENKKVVITAVQQMCDQSQSLIVSDYRGVTAKDMTALRRKAHESNVHLCIVKNTLARRAFAKTKYENLVDSLNGPIILAFSLTEPGSGAKLLSEFVKENQNLEVKALSLGGDVLAASRLEAVSNLPNKEQAIALLLVCAKAPVGQVATMLNNVAARLTRVLHAVAQQKQ